MASRKESGLSSNAGMASTGGTLDSPVKQIQIEGLVSVTLRVNAYSTFVAHCAESAVHLAGVDAKLKCESHHGG